MQQAAETPVQHERGARPRGLRRRLPRPLRRARRWARSTCMALGAAAAVAACGSEAAEYTSPVAIPGHPSPGARLSGAASWLVPAIVGGLRAGSGEYPATGVLLYAVAKRGPTARPMGAMLCTGTLIAPDVVLAAAHCRQPELPEGGTARVLYFFSLEPDVSSFGPRALDLPKDAVRVSQMEVHPDYENGRKPRAVSQANDLALFYLEQPFDVPPARLASSSEAERLLHTGRPVTIVGYGRQGDLFYSVGDDGIKMRGRSTLSEVGRYELEVGYTDDDAYKCFGDSGGPTFAQSDSGNATLVGVTSRGASWTVSHGGMKGTGPGCRMGGIDTRVDPYLPWIDASMRRACDAGERPSCPPAWRGLLDQ